jgi:hypothetical protein
MNAVAPKLARHAVRIYRDGFRHNTEHFSRFYRYLDTISVKQSPARIYSHLGARRFRTFRGDQLERRFINGYTEQVKIDAP